MNDITIHEILLYFFIYCREFEEVLKAMRWPHVISTVKTPAVTNDNFKDLKDRMGRLFEKLLRLQLPYPLSFKNHKTDTTNILKAKECLSFFLY